MKSCDGVVSVELSTPSPLALPATPMTGVLPSQSLYARQLVHAHDHAIRWRVEVEVADAGGLLAELGIDAVQPSLNMVGRMSAPYNSR